MVDYRKWDHIEISDDEDDVHPNIDTPSLFRWRHQARTERMAKEKEEKDTFEKEYTVHQRKIMDMKQQIAQVEETEAADKLSQMKLDLAEMERQEAEFQAKEEELKKKERLAPQNIGTKRSFFRSGDLRSNTDAGTIKSSQHWTQALLVIAIGFMSLRSSAE